MSRRYWDWFVSKTSGFYSRADSDPGVNSLIPILELIVMYGAIPIPKPILTPESIPLSELAQGIYLSISLKSAPESNSFPESESASELIPKTVLTIPSSHL